MPIPLSALKHHLEHGIAFGNDLGAVEAPPVSQRQLVDRDEVMILQPGITVLVQDGHQWRKFTGITQNQWVLHGGSEEGMDVEDATDNGYLRGPMIIALPEDDAEDELVKDRFNGPEAPEFDEHMIVFTPALSDTLMIENQSTEEIFAEEAVRRYLYPDDEEDEGAVLQSAQPLVGPNGEKVVHMRMDQLENIDVTAMINRFHVLDMLELDSDIERWEVDAFILMGDDIDATYETLRVDKKGSREEIAAHIAMMLMQKMAPDPVAFGCVNGDGITVSLLSGAVELLAYRLGGFEKITVMVQMEAVDFFKDLIRE